MATELEDLRTLQTAETIADGIWKQVTAWKKFPQDVVGRQLTRAADSIGANIAESFGRFHYGEKLNFLYYARGSLFETKYWLNRAFTRQLMLTEDIENYATQLTDLARQLNAFAGSLKSQRYANGKSSSTLKEANIEYTTDISSNISGPLFTETDLNWLQQLPTTNL